MNLIKREAFTPTFNYIYVLKETLADIQMDLNQKQLEGVQFGLQKAQEQVNYIIRKVNEMGEPQKYSF